VPIGVGTPRRFTPVSALRGPGLISEKVFEKEGGAAKEDEQCLMLLSARDLPRCAGRSTTFDNNSESAEPCSKNFPRLNPRLNANFSLGRFQAALENVAI
jgi:hypothetical protein